MLTSQVLDRSFHIRVLPRHVFMPFQTALAVSRSLQALGLARTFGPVRGSSWGGAEASERLPVRCLRRAGHWRVDPGSCTQNPSQNRT